MGHPTIRGREKERKRDVGTLNVVAGPCSGPDLKKSEVRENNR
jgi:hypothetical protein